MNYVLTNLEHARATISNKKLKFYIISIKIIGFIYNANSYYSSIFKIVVIIK